MTAVLAMAAGALEAGPGRSAAVARAQVWRPIDTPHLDLRRGPRAKRGFAPGETVRCRFDPKILSGHSPKFACAIGDDVVKVKYRGTNGEVFAEVAATRLLWALGFGADRVYPTRVVCRGCPEVVEGIDRANGDRIVVPATIERKFPAEEIDTRREGWSWSELDTVSEEAGGAPRAHRDALKLLAVFLQHTDSKAEQQRLVCLDDDDSTGCRRPFLLINDVGLTFGAASWSNANPVSSANLRAWADTPVWRDGEACVGNLPKSFTGTLDNPVISEAGRAFLAARLQMLSEAQLRDLFSVARFDIRPRDPVDPRSGPATIQEWVDVFVRKRAEIVNRRCA